MERHKHLTDSQRLERLASWLDDDYRQGAKMSEEAIFDVVFDLKRIATKIKETPTIPQQPHGEICAKDIKELVGTCIKTNGRYYSAGECCEIENIVEKFLLKHKLPPC